jgi:hypothetical protein
MTWHNKKVNTEVTTLIALLLFLTFGWAGNSFSDRIY